MPALGKGNECIKLLLLQASKGMSVSLFRCFSFFLAHNQRCGNSVSHFTWKGLCGKIVHLVANLGCIMLENATLLR
jgi:hypothetical protein